MIARLTGASIAALLALSAPALAQTPPTDPAAAPAAAESAPAPNPAPAPVAEAPPATPAAPASSTPAAVSLPALDAVAGAPPAGKGQVVFFRKSAFQGGAVWFNIREQGQALGKMTSGVYFVQNVEPGLHVYSAATEATNTLRLEVEPDETYYVEGTIAMGLMVGRPNLGPATKERFAKFEAKMKRAAVPAMAATAAVTPAPAAPAAAPQAAPTATAATPAV